MIPNFYEQLGVSRNADTGLITLAHDRATLGCEPAERRHLDLALEILSDADRRRVYDRIRTTAEMATGIWESTLAVAFLEEGDKLLQEQENRAALSLYTGAIRLDPTARAHNNRGVAYARLMAFEKALDDFSNAAKYEADEFHISRNLQRLQSALDEVRQCEPIGDRPIHPYIPEQTEIGQGISIPESQNSGFEGALGCALLAGIGVGLFFLARWWFGW